MIAVILVVFVMCCVYVNGQGSMACSTACSGCPVGTQHCAVIVNVGINSCCASTDVCMEVNGASALCCDPSTPGCNGSDDSVTVSITCFSGSSTVELENGNKALISDLQVGDKVLSWKADVKERTFTEVVYLPHSRNNKEASFVELNFEYGVVVQLTPRHMVPVVNCDDISDVAITEASAIHPQQCVLDSMSTPQRVVNTKMVTSNGLYSFVTLDEFIVVNGMVMSPFSHHHQLGHFFYQFHRAIYVMSKSFGQFQKSIIFSALDSFTHSIELVSQFASNYVL